jgi:hypothetical protein
MLLDQIFDVWPEVAFLDEFFVGNSEEATRSQDSFHSFASGPAHLLS